MANIYELTQDQEEIVNLLFSLDDADEQDAQEIEYLNKKLSAIRGSAENTILFLNGIYLELKAIAEKRKEAKIKAQKRQTTAENAQERLKNRIIELCDTFDIEKVIDDESGLGIRTQLSPGSIKYDDNFDYSKLPIHCRETKIVPINSEVKEYLKDGGVISGVEIVKSVGIRTI
ncbi:MAG: siphovirus Gp157 family protein [Methanobacterium sp.]